MHTCPIRLVIDKFFSTYSRKHENSILIPCSLYLLIKQYSFESPDPCLFRSSKIRTEILRLSGPSLIMNNYIYYEYIPFYRSCTALVRRECGRSTRGVSSLTFGSPGTAKSKYCCGLPCSH